MRVAVLAADGDPRLGRAGVLGDVRERLGDDEVGGGLDLAGQSAQLSSTST